MKDWHRRRHWVHGVAGWLERHPKLWAFCGTFAGAFCGSGWTVLAGAVIGWLIAMGIWVIFLEWSDRIELQDRLEGSRWE